MQHLTSTAEQEALVSAEHQGIEQRFLEIMQQKCKQRNFRDKSLLNLIEQSTTPKEFTNKFLAARMVTKSEYMDFRNYFEKLNNQVFRNRFISESGKNHILQDTTANLGILFLQMKGREGLIGLLSTKVMVQAQRQTKKYTITHVCLIAQVKDRLVRVRLQNFEPGSASSDYFEVTLRNGMQLVEYTDGNIEKITDANGAMVSVKESVPDNTAVMKVVQEPMIKPDEKSDNGLPTVPKIEKLPQSLTEVDHSKCSISTGWQYVDHDDDFVLVNHRGHGTATSEEIPLMVEL